MEPIIAYCILESQTMFMNAADTLREHCVEGITANSDVCRRYVEHSIGVVTALNPLLGYDVTTELAAEALKTRQGNRPTRAREKVAVGGADQHVSSIQG